MGRFFNISADCKAGLHYMVDLRPKLEKSEKWLTGVTEVSLGDKILVEAVV